MGKIMNGNTAGTWKRIQWFSFRSHSWKRVCSSGPTFFPAFFCHLFFLIPFDFFPIFFSNHEKLGTIKRTYCKTHHQRRIFIVDYVSPSRLKETCTIHNIPRNSIYTFFFLFLSVCIWPLTSSAVLFLKDFLLAFFIRIWVSKWTNCAFIINIECDRIWTNRELDAITFSSKIILSPSSYVLRLSVCHIYGNKNMWGFSNWSIVSSK